LWNLKFPEMRQIRAHFMECGAFAVHRQFDIVASTDRPSDAEGRSVFCWRLSSESMPLTEGRCASISKIRAAIDKNGSSPPRFSTDEGRTYFLVELLAHPQLPGVQSHDEAQVLADTENAFCSL
jgi:hypothetical protein